MAFRLRSRRVTLRHGTPVQPSQPHPCDARHGLPRSGKTTLINAGLKSPDLSRTVVVVNEFGQVGLDHQLYTSSNDAVVVLENGCLCCTVKSDLVATMNNLFHERARGDLPDFDNVVIETTGLAEPGPVMQAFLSEPTLDGLYRITNVVTMVDAVNWMDTSAKHEEALRQVALADDVLISKLDLVPEDRFTEIERQIRAMNPVARVAKADFSTSPSPLCCCTPDSMRRMPWQIRRNGSPSRTTRPMNISWKPMV